MADLLIALGPNQSFWFIGSTYHELGGIPDAASKLIKGPECQSFKAIALGSIKGSYVIQYTDHNGKNFTIWDHVPPRLDTFLSKDGVDANDVKIWLGPSGCFFALGSESSCWDRIPDDMNHALQGWQGRQGWTSGAPKWMSIGMSGCYIVVSERGAAAWDLATYYNTLSGFIEGWRAGPDASDFPSKLEAIWLHPYRQDEFVVMWKTRKIWSTLSKPLTGVLNEAMGQSGTGTRENDPPPRQDRAEPEHGTHNQTKKARQNARQQEYREMYFKWKAECSKLAHPYMVVGLHEFPAPPEAACVCTEPACRQWKSPQTALQACKHDLRRLITFDPEYTREWLKKERVKWHPDKFTKVRVGLRADFQAKATHMFTLYEALMDDL